MYWTGTGEGRNFKNTDRLANTGSVEADRRLQEVGISLSYCPVCGKEFNLYGPPGPPLTNPFWPSDREHNCGHEMEQLRFWAIADIAIRLWKFDWSAATATTLTRGVDGYSADFKQHFADGMGILTLGTYGSGKTTAMVHVLKHALAKERSAAFAKFEDILAAFRDRKYLKMLTEVKYLLIDEVKLPATEAQQIVYAQYGEVISKRYDALRPTLLTGNVTKDEFEQTYPEIDSRLAECSFMITPPSEDFRRAS